MNLKQKIGAFAEKAMFREEPIPDFFPPNVGWKKFEIAGAHIPPHSEAAHTFYMGAPGTGKSVGIFERLDQIREYRQPAIVYDKSGEFTEKYYREGIDILLSPFDVRSPAWSLFKELRLSFDVTNIAEALIEQPNNGEKFWSANARILFADLVRQLDAAGLQSNEDLNHYANKLELKELHEFMAGTHGGTLVDPRSEKTAIGIRAELGSCMAAWPFLKDSDDAFSLREFVTDCDAPDTDKSDRWVFITSRGDAHSLMKPLISLWLEIVCSGILSLTPRPDRRIHLVIDEIASLQKLPSLQNLMAEGRKYGVAVDIGLQLFSQLKNVYGNDLAEAMLGVSKSWVVLQTTEPSTAKLLSEGLGDREEKEKKENRTMSAADERDSVSLSTEKKVSKVVLPGEILSFPTLTGVLKVPDMPLLRIRLKPKSRKSIANGYELRPDIAWAHAKTASQKAEQVKEILRQTDKTQADLVREFLKVLDDPMPNDSPYGAQSDESDLV